MRPVTCADYYRTPRDRRSRSALGRPGGVSLRDAVEQGREPESPRHAPPPLPGWGMRYPTPRSVRM